MTAGLLIVSTSSQLSPSDSNHIIRYDSGTTCHCPPGFQRVVHGESELTPQASVFLLVTASSSTSKSTSSFIQKGRVDRYNDALLHVYNQKYTNWSP